jgi:hypothetical protein
MLDMSIEPKESAVNKNSAVLNISEDLTMPESRGRPRTPERKEIPNLKPKTKPKKEWPQVRKFLAAVLGLATLVGVGPAVI